MTLAVEEGEAFNPNGDHRRPMDTRMTTVLVLIDLQKDYFPGGAMELVGAEDAVTQARSLLQAFRTRGLPVLRSTFQAVSVRRLCLRTCELLVLRASSSQA